jgi:type VI secretion system secreted protein VgrG
MDALSAAKGLASGLADPSSLLASFASAFSQGSQALKLHCSSDAGIPAGTLLPHRLTGHQGINQGLHLELEVVSNDASLELKTLLGVAVQVSIVTDAGSEHELSGLVTEVHQEGSEGGFASYRLVIEDGLSILRLARSARVAMDVDVLDLTDTILQAHLDDNPVLAAAFQVDNRCKASYPDRPFWMQFNETDADYLRRIWAREGISYVVMSAEGSTPDHPQHVLVLFDDPMDLDQNASSTVRFHRSDSTEQADTITGWNGRRTLQSGSVARSAWDHTLRAPVG